MSIFVSVNSSSLKNISSRILSMYESGYTFICAKTASDCMVYLPIGLDANIGVAYKFINTTVSDKVMTFDSQIPNGLKGHVRLNNGDYFQIGGRKVSFTAAALDGDYIEAVFDGTFWNINGSSGSSGITSDNVITVSE